MLTQLTLDLVTKLPLSAVPRWGKGPHKGKLDQKALQVDGEFNQCAPHPVYKGLFYFSKKTNGNQRWFTDDYWKNLGIPTPTEINEKRRAAREHNLNKPDSEPSVLEDGQNVGYIDQMEMCTRSILIGVIGVNVGMEPKYGKLWKPLIREKSNTKPTRKHPKDESRHVNPLRNA